MYYLVLWQVRGSVQKIERGSDIGRVRSPEGEQPIHDENDSLNCHLSRSKGTRWRLMEKARQEY